MFSCSTFSYYATWFYFCSFVLFVLMLFIGIGFFTLLERKLLGLSQLRLGPNKVGSIGIFQPLLDGIKLLIKELFFFSGVEFYLFLGAPLFSILVLVLGWFLLNSYVSGVSFSFWGGSFLVIIGLSCYSSFLSGWGGKSKYSILGAIRVVTSVVSYDICLAILLLSPLLFSQNFAFSNEVKMNILLTPIFVLWFLSCLAEVARAPFDLSEAESELVSGMNVEFGCVGFTQLFLFEYGMVLFLSGSSSTLFMASSVFWFFFLFYIFLFFRSCYPRVRIDFFMELMWVVFLPSSLIFWFGLIMFIIII